MGSAVNRLRVGRRLYLNIIESSKFKTDKLTVLFRQPLKKETASKNALLFNLLTAGSRELPDIAAINDKLYELYGATLATINVKRGDIQEFGLSLSFLNSRYTFDNEDITVEGIKLIHEILLDPLIKDGSFYEDKLAIEKKNKIDEIKAEINNKGRYSCLKCLELMCGDDPYSIKESGDIAEVEAIKGDDLYRHYKHLLSTAGLEVYYVGSTDIQKLGENLKLYLTLPDGEPAETPPCGNVLPAAAEPAYSEEVMPVSQGKLAIGFTTGINRSDDRFPALWLFNTIYGMGPVSKLFVNVREKLSLCYSCRSDIIASKGIMLVSAGIDSGQKDKALSEILAQLEDMKAGRISDDELEEGRRALVNGLRAAADSAEAMINWAINAQLDGNGRTADYYIDKVSGVTREEVASAAREILLHTVYFLRGEDEEKNA